MQTLLATMLFAIVIGIPNALMLVMLLNTREPRTDIAQLTEDVRAKRNKSLVDGAKIARNCMIFVIGAAMFYFGLSMGEGHLDATAVQLSLEGLLGAILPLIVWRLFASRARMYKVEV